MHIIINLWQILQWQSLVNGLDFAGSGNSQSLVSVLAVAYIRADKTLGQEHGKEDVNVDLRVRRKSNSDTSAVGSVKNDMCKRIFFAAFKTTYRMYSMAGYEGASQSAEGHDF